MSMQKVEVLVENSKEVEAIIAALRRAEELGEIDFPFNVQVEEWLTLSEQAEQDALVDEYYRTRRAGHSNN